MEFCNYSNRFGRQYGLVHQDVIENLNILIIGDNEILPYLLLNLAFCGVGSLQGGVYLSPSSETVTEKNVRNQFLLLSEDVGSPKISTCKKRLHKYVPLFDLQLWPQDAEKHIIPDVTVYLPNPDVEMAYKDAGRCRLFGQLSPAGIYIGQDPVVVDPFPPNVLTASLASLAGAILSQEILRLSNTLRHFTVVDQSLQVLMRLRSKEIQKYVSKNQEARSSIHHGITARLKLGGENLKVEFVSPTDIADEGIFSVCFPNLTLLSRLIFDSVEIIEEPLIKNCGVRPPLFFSLFGEEKLVDSSVEFQETCLPEVLEHLKVLVLGVGGLGTWLTGLLTISPIRDLHFALVDSDTMVEEHNLNRQILYNETDIGRPKVIAALDALRDLRKDLNIHIYPLELNEGFLRYLKHEVFFEYEDPSKSTFPSPGDGEIDFTSRQQGMLAKDFSESQVIISCLDNMQSRWILNCASFLQGKPFINGGVNAFRGTADLVDPRFLDATLVTRYGETIKTDSGKIQCGGAVPILSIVTTNAVIASVEALLALSCALGKRPEFNRLYFDGTLREIYQDYFKERNMDDPLGIDALMRTLEPD